MDQRPNQSLVEFDYPQTKEDALVLIRKAVEGKRQDIEYGESLLTLVPNDEANIMLQPIIADDRQHELYYQTIYQAFTGESLVIQSLKNDGPLDFQEGIKRLIFRKSQQVELDRRILFAMHDHLHIHMLTEIITDELRHGTILNLLFLLTIH